MCSHVIQMSMCMVHLQTNGQAMLYNVTIDYWFFESLPAYPSSTKGIVHVVTEEVSVQVIYYSRQCIQYTDCKGFSMGLYVTIPTCPLTSGWLLTSQNEHYFDYVPTTALSLHQYPCNCILMHTLFILCKV